jgi:drug/metabolite transporter (DMT)-like permease
MQRRLISTAPGNRLDAFGAVEWSLLGAAALIWGSSFLLIAMGLEAFAPGVVTVLRLLFGAAALGIIPAARRPVARDDLPAIAVLGLVWMAVPLLLFPIAQQWVDSGVAGMINGSVPVFSAFLAALLLRRMPSRHHVFGILIGFGGVVVISLPSFGSSAGTTAGILLIVAASFCYGLAVNLAVPLQQRYGSLPVLFRCQLVAIVLTLPFGIGGIPGSRFDWDSFLAVAALGALGTGLAFVAMATLVGRAGATRGAVAVYFIPVVAVVLGVVVRHEQIQPLALLGTAIVIAGAFLSSRSETPVPA